MKYTFPVAYGDEQFLVEIDASLVALVAGVLDKFFVRDVWVSDTDYELGYNAIAQLKADLMGAGIKKLQLEIRAMRGVDDFNANVYDTDANPFELSLGTIEDTKRQLETANTTLTAIKQLVEGMQNAETLEDIKASAAQIALLLA